MVLAQQKNEFEGLREAQPIAAVEIQMGKSNRAASPDPSIKSRKSDSDRSPKAAHGMDKSPQAANAVPKVRRLLALSNRRDFAHSLAALAHSLEMRLLIEFAASSRWLQHLGDRIVQLLG